MIHVLLLITCILSVEVLIKSNFLFISCSIANISKEAIRIIALKNVSEHWKEKILPLYALRIMICSIKILIIFLIIISLFIITDLYFDNFLTFSLSLIGVFESLVFAIGYGHLRKLLTK